MMKQSKFLALAILLLVAACACAQDVEQQMRAAFLNRVLTLRTPAADDSLHFDQNGAMDRGHAGCPWTLCADIAVSSVRVAKGDLELQGTRVWIYFKGDPLKPIYVRTQVPVTVRIQFTDAPHLTLALRRVFLQKGERLSDIVPQYWVNAVGVYVESRAATTTQASGAAANDSLIKKVGNGVSAPKPVKSPDPTFTEAAKEAHIEGKVMISLIIRPDGEPAHLIIVQPLGMGLDEMALKAVQQWRFRPALKDGKPVAVFAQVGVNFHRG